MENEMKNKNKYYIEKYTISFLLLGWEVAMGSNVAPILLQHVSNGDMLP